MRGALAVILLAASVAACGTHQEATEGTAAEVTTSVGTAAEVTTVAPSSAVVRCVPGDWNAQQCEGADFAGADLHGMSLGGFDLRRADLSEADLTEADLDEAELSDATLAGADLSQASLRDADMTGVDLTGAQLAGADLRGADLSGAKLIGADLSGASAFYTNWENVTLQETVLDGVQLTGATGLTDAALAANFGVAESTLGGTLSAHAVILDGDLAKVWIDACEGRPSTRAASGWSEPPQVVFPEADRVQGSVDRGRWPAAPRFADIAACYDLKAQTIERVTSCGIYGSMGGIDPEVFLVIGQLPVRLVDVATGTELATFTITSHLPDGCPQYVLHPQVGGVGYGADQRNPVFDVLDQVDALPRSG